MRRKHLAIKYMYGRFSSSSSAVRFFVDNKSSRYQRMNHASFWFDVTPISILVGLLPPVNCVASIQDYGMVAMSSSWPLIITRWLVALSSVLTTSRAAFSPDGKWNFFLFSYLLFLLLLLLLLQFVLENKISPIFFLLVLLVFVILVVALLLIVIIFLFFAACIRVREKWKGERDPYICCIENRMRNIKT